jgi:hypothetical protein
MTNRSAPAFLDLLKEIMASLIEIWVLMHSMAVHEASILVLLCYLMPIKALVLVGRHQEALILVVIVIARLDA